VELDWIRSESRWLGHEASGYAEGHWFTQDFHFLPRTSQQLMTLQVGLASYWPNVDEAQRSAAAVGISDASFTDGSGTTQLLQFDRHRPDFWETHVEGFNLSATISAFVLRGQTKIWWTWQAWS
jgi:hypothetical protein